MDYNDHQSFRGGFRIGNDMEDATPDEEATQLDPAESHRRSARNTLFLILSVIAGGFFAVLITWLIVVVLPHSSLRQPDLAPIDHQIGIKRLPKAEEITAKRPIRLQSKSGPGPAGVPSNRNPFSEQKLLYHWKDAKGTHHYSDQPPPEPGILPDIRPKTP